MYLKHVLEKLIGCNHPYECEPWSCDCGEWPWGCCKQWPKTTCCDDKFTYTACDDENYDCSYYSCPKGTTLSGSTCYY